MKFFAGAAALLPFAFSRGFTQKSSNTIKPFMLKEGDTVGIIAPATAVSDPDDIFRAEEAASHFGLNIRFGSNLKNGSGYKTRTPEERTDDLHEMFSDDGIKAVFCIRGGYGSATILDKIDYDLIRRNPKILLGYSDITALHLAIGKMSGMVTFHGPVMLSAFSEFTEEHFRKALFSSEPLGEQSNPAKKNNFREVYPLRTISTGRAEGVLTGGNLSLISSLMGTPYEIDTEDKILLIEDVGEEPYRIDRMMTQLRLAGKLEKAAGIILGKCSGCGYGGVYPSRVWDYSLGEVYDNVLKEVITPAFYGLLFGHTADQLTIPLGVSAVMDADECVLKITESALSE